MHAMFARITKVDERRREVTGRAAQEVVDRDNEMFDYASSKPEFQKWSAEVHADSGGKSLGNVRSMHGNNAAGKVTNIDFNDVEKAIDITAKIVDPVEWDKVMQGVHTGFSIGGRYARKWSEVQNGKMIQRYTAVPSEISIVDRPSCPTAKFFSIHKRDGSIVKREFMHTQQLQLIRGKLMLVDESDPVSLFKALHAAGPQTLRSDETNRALRKSARAIGLTEIDFTDIKKEVRLSQSQKRVRKLALPPQSSNASWDDVRSDDGARLASDDADDEMTAGTRPTRWGGQTDVSRSQSVLAIKRAQRRPKIAFLR